MILSVFPFLIFWLFTCTSNSFIQVKHYDDLQRLGSPCYPKDTCQSLNTATEDHLWRNRACECDVHCVRHSTCCIDSNYLDKEQFVLKRSDEVCKLVQTTNLMVSMVSTCLLEWSKDFIYEKCVHPENELKDPLSEVPVTSIESMTTYRNFFCAICNNDVDSARFWNIEVKGPINLNLDQNSIIDRLEYNAELNAWGFFESDLETHDREFKTTQMKFSLKNGLEKFVMPCHPNIISNCSFSYKSTRLRHKCQAYYSPIKGQKQGSEDFFIYRNIHCALCNGLRTNRDELSCMIKSSVKKSPSLSFTKLVDVNRKGGDKVGRMSLCKQEQVYDPFFKKCRSLACAVPNHVIKNGACVKSD